jgi:hypothetical protein
MPEDNPLYTPQEIATSQVNVVAANNNKTWIEWIEVLFLRFVFATIKFVPF